MLQYLVPARRIDDHGSRATTKQAEITLDTGVKSRNDAFNPAELFSGVHTTCSEWQL